MKSLISILFCLSMLGVIAQNPLEPRMKTRLTCYDIGYNALELIPRYYEKGDTDSLYYIIDFWENKCGMSEYSSRIKTLLSIQNNSFEESQVDVYLYKNLLQFAEFVNWVNIVDKNYEDPQVVYKSTFSEPEIIFEYYTFTNTVAQKIYNEKEVKGDEKYILKLFMNEADTFYKYLKNTDPDSSALSDLYQKEVKKYNNLIEGGMGLISGIWIPYGNASKLGNHPIFGFYFDGKVKKYSLGMTMLFRPGKSKNEYLVKHEDSLYVTDEYFGVNVSLDMGYELFKSKKSSLTLMGGIGFDAFDALTLYEDDDNEDNDFHRSISSLNLNTGLCYRYFYNRNSYIGIDTRYNFVDYKNSGGTDLTGNTQSIRILLGFIGNRMKKYNLERLRYYE